MDDCNQFPRGSRQRQICSGESEMSLDKVNRFRALYGLYPLEAEKPELISGDSATPNSTLRKPKIVRSTGVRVKSAGGGCCGGSKPASHSSKAVVKRPGVFTRAQNLAVATLKHLADDTAPTPLDVIPFREVCCNSCPQNVNGECQLCGCLLQPNAINQGKIRWRSEQCPAGRWFRHNKNRVSFTENPTRHLIYHIYPRRSSVYGDRIWTWNLDQLAKRIDIFNGRRFVAVSTDENSATVASVKSYLNSVGIDCEVTAYKNNPQKQEMVSFLSQLTAIRQLNPGNNDVVFRAHAKGVKHDNFFDKSGRLPWVKALYTTGLDDLLAIDDALESHVLAGAFRFHKAFNAGKTWCYCGSFYWFRAKDVFARDWKTSNEKFWGVEEWPGRIARIEEAACLIHDFTTQFTALAKLDKWDSEGIWKELDTWLSVRGLPLIERP